ncbi:MAG: type II toxin-antitoxin system RelE/ParE family toxin [Candidatus Altiarchaeota archaeon]|nr:type II toxin-antitoxin system RelE/ParE family toxin [Candidatus Altiarchaeota archaeon]
MSFDVKFTNKAERNLKNIPEPFRKRLFAAASALGKNPYPRGLEKLTDRGDTYRIRVGKYWIVWFIDHGMVHIVNIDKRPKVY